MLSARVLTYSFLKSRSNPSSIKWRSLASTIFRRTIRLAIPILFAAILQQQLCLGGYFADTIEANAYLKSGALGIPGWCSISDPGKFWGFFLDIFTDNDSQYMLYTGSVLWSMFSQFWGSMWVYGVSALVIYMNGNRYFVYAILLLYSWFVNSYSLIYLLGLLLSDMDASGITRKIQKAPLYLVVPLEFALLSLALFFLISANSADTIDSWALYNTIRDGIPGSALPIWSSANYSLNGWGNPGVWPQMTRMTYWMIPFLTMCWLELCFAAQYLLQFKVLVFLGKITFGMYITQMAIIYGVMPPLVLALKNAGWDYWSNITTTYVVCLSICILAGYVFYKTIDEFALRLARWSWSYLESSKNMSFFQWVSKAYNDTIRGACALPGSFAGLCVSKYRQCRRTCYKTYRFVTNWRNMSVRDPIVEPSTMDAEMLGLHSTEWHADLSNDKKAQRTAWLLRLNSYMWILHLCMIIGLSALWLLANPFGRWGDEVITFNSLWRILWILSLPYCFITLLGFATPRIAHDKIYFNTKPVRRNYIRNFYIAVVTKGSNESAVRRGYETLSKLVDLHPSVQLVVLTDEPHAYPDLNNVVCPKSFKSALGKAKHKARALEYFRITKDVDEYDWILHMDEESTIDAESLRRCFEFIRYETHHIGQGIITYNAHGYWSNWLFTVVDAIRVGDDLARFNMQYTWFKRPVFGVHGSFLLTNGQVEKETTWDHGSLAEDFEFSHAAWRNGFTFGPIHGIVREQSPTSIMDVMKQRRRWYLGIREIKGVYYLPQIMCRMWTSGIFCLTVTIINIPLSVVVDPAPSPFWLSLISVFSFGCLYWIYLWGIIFQELDYGTPWYMGIVHLIATVPLQLASSIIEAAALIYAMSDETKEFQVIKK